MTEATALLRQQHGKEDALAWFIKKYTPYICTVIRYIIGESMTEEDVEETASDVFLALWEESDRVCDEASPYFNTWQERDDPTLIPWGDDVEQHLENYPTLYAWACVIEYNRPPDVIPDRGCAIFLHCAKAVTGGCVGLRREDMLSVLKWLDCGKNPYILITGTEYAASSTGSSCPASDACSVSCA